MLLRTVLRRSLLHSRRRWEQRIASVLSEQEESRVDAVAQRFDRIYKDRRYTPVECAFPLRDEPRWVGLPERAASSSFGASRRVVDQPCGARVVRAAVIGAPNSGKTSLLNALVLGHVGAVSGRSGSTSGLARAAATVHATQLVLLDTPGAAKAGAVAAWDALTLADVALLALPAGLGVVEPAQRTVARELVRRAAAREMPVVLVVTMMDRVQTPRHRELYFSMRADFEAMGLPIAAAHETSVKGGTGLVELKDFLCRYAVPGEWEYFRGEASDASPVDRVSELIWQCFLELLPHEIPHKMRHRIIGWTRKDSGTTEVITEVFFDRPAYMFTFYGKLEAICFRTQRLVEQELKGRYRFVFQAFIAPGGISSR